jgi:serine/threonine protein kinase
MYCSGNKKIDNLTKEMQLKRRSHNDMVFEWIPYNQFNNIKQINKGDFSTIHSAIWKDGPLQYYEEEYIRESSDKEVVLKCLHNSQNNTNKFLDEVCN